MTTRTWTFRSRARGGVPTRCRLLWPAGPTTDLASPPPVVVALHGLDQDHTIISALGAAAALTAYLRRGGPPFALVAADGGTSYWHPHHDEDAGAMVVDELLPQLAERGMSTDRIGLLGWSMGGYGALRLAGLLGPSRVTSVTAVSPALWTDPAGASPSGFDGPGEYERYSVMHDQARLSGLRVRIDCGLGDPFADAVRTYRDRLRDVRPAVALSGGFSHGGHDRDYWRRVLPRELAFAGSTLAG